MGQYMYAAFTYAEYEDLCGKRTHNFLKKSSNSTTVFGKKVKRKETSINPILPKITFTMHLINLYILFFKKRVHFIVVFCKETPTTQG